MQPREDATRQARVLWDRRFFVFISAMLLSFALTSSSFAASGDSTLPYRVDVVVYFLMPIAYLAYVCVPLRWWKLFQMDDLYSSDLVGDTDNVPFDEVPQIKGYELEPYICPCLTEKIYKSAKRSQLEVQSETNDKATRKSAAVTMAPEEPAHARLSP